MLLDASINKAATGNGVYVRLLGRHAGSSDYRLRLRFLPDGVVHLAWSKVVAGSEGTVSEVNVSALSYSVGDVLRVRYQLTSNANGTTTLTGKVWKVGTAEPTSAQITGTDSEPSLQGSGAIGVQTSLGSTATNAPLVVAYDNLSVTSN